MLNNKGNSSALSVEVLDTQRECPNSKKEKRSFIGVVL